MLELFVWSFSVQRQGTYVRLNVQVERLAVGAVIVWLCSRYYHILPKIFCTILAIPVLSLLLWPRRCSRLQSPGEPRSFSLKSLHLRSFFFFFFKCGSNFHYLLIGECSCILEKLSENTCLCFYTTEPILKTSESHRLRSGIVNKLPSTHCLAACCH